LKKREKHIGNHEQNPTSFNNFFHFVQYMSPTVQKKKSTTVQKKKSSTVQKSKSPVVQKKNRESLLHWAAAITGGAAVAAVVGVALYKRNKTKRVQEMVKEEGLQIDRPQRVGQGFMNGLYYSGVDKITKEWYLFKYAENTASENKIYEKSSVLYKVFNRTDLASKDCSKMLILPTNKKIDAKDTVIIYKTPNPIVKSLFGEVAKSSFYEAKHPPSDKDVNLIYRICSAIYCLHSWGVAHRHVSPMSIVIDTLNEVFLLPSVETCNSTFLGYCHNPMLSLYPDMLFFTPPEIRVKVKDSKVKTSFNEAKRMDVWGLGVTIYLYLFGRFPYDAGKMTYITWGNMHSTNPMIRQEGVYKYEKYMNDVKTLDKNTRLFKPVTLESSYFHDLLQGMLELDYRKRFTSENIVKRLKDPKFAQSFKDTVQILEKNLIFI